MEETKQRIIQEYVPGRQITLAHLIASPQKGIYLKLGLDDACATAIGILTITPCEGVIIAADIATKAANVDIGFLDRFGGSLLSRVTWPALRRPCAKFCVILAMCCATTLPK